LRIFSPNSFRKENDKSENFPINLINMFLVDLRYFSITGKVNLAGGSLAGYSGLTATAPSTGIPGGAAGSVWSGSDEPGRTTIADSPSFAYGQWCFSGQLGCRQQE
jgi:hypothetical protein